MIMNAEVTWDEGMRWHVTRIVVIAWCLLAAGSTIAESVPEPAAGQPTREMLVEHLAELDRQLRQRFGRPVTEPDGERFRRQLRLVEGWAWQLVPAQRAEVLDRVQALERLTRDLERAAEPDPAAAAAAPPARLPRGEGGGPINDACADAWPIDAGTFTGDTSRATPDGAASCGMTEGSPDVWFRLAVPDDLPTGPPGVHQIFANVEGFDTVLSAHSTCPGTGANELACNDNVRGLGSSLAFDLGAGEVLLRLSGFAGAGGPWKLTVGAWGAVSGTVTDTAGAPIRGLSVVASSRIGYVGGSGTTDFAGRYTVQGLPAGEYSVFAGGDGSHVGELHDGRSCPRRRCDETRGTPVRVELNRVTGGIDFELELGGVITGRVTGIDGQPLRSLWVAAHRRGDDFAGDRTDPQGRFRLAGLDSDTPGIDFALERLGSITGTVTEAATGEAIPFAGVVAEIAEVLGGVNLDPYSTSADAEGRYTLASLFSGSYRVRTRTETHRDELFADVVCEAEDCDPAAAELVRVRVAETTPDVDFALVRLGSIAGTVTEAATGGPVADFDVRVVDDRGFEVGRAVTDAAGRYAVEPLPTGEYLVRAHSSSPALLSELYDDVPCPGRRCDLADGRRVAVAPGLTTSGIDFALDRPGSIRGTVRAAATGDPLVGRVTVQDAAGRFAGRATADAEGRYTVERLAAGEHFVSVLRGGYAAQVYDRLACAPPAVATRWTARRWR